MPQNKAIDPIQFAQLYDQYAAIMLGVITKMVPDEVQAATLLEAIFVHIIGPIEPLQKNNRPLFISLLHLARQAVDDFLHESRTHQPIAVRLTHDAKVVSQLLSNKNTSLLASDTGCLAEKQRKELFERVLFKNCTPEEAASHIGIPREQARKQLRLALQQVRRSKQ